jgi:hypothetical protein
LERHTERDGDVRRGRKEPNVSSGAVVMGVVIVIIVGITAYLVGTLARSIQNEKSTSMRLWKNFGLSLGFCSLFFLSWLAHGVAQWQRYTDEQREHNEPVEIGDFIADFSTSTLENWQSEFLQLFSFTIMAAVLIHKGSAESKDGTDRIEMAIKRLEEKLETEPVMQARPADRPGVHVLPDEMQSWQLRNTERTEPEGYYDTQEEAIQAGRELARSKRIKLFIHTPDGDIRDTESFD